MAAAAGAAPLLRDLPDAIVLWEILVRLDPKSLLRCRAVRRDWRSATSTRRFLLAHHARQPALSIFSHCKCLIHDMKQDILVLDHQAEPAQFHTVVRFDHPYHVAASCDGLLLLETYSIQAGSRTGLSVCNPTTREMTYIGPLLDFNILGLLLCGCMRSMLVSIPFQDEVTTACVDAKITKPFCSAFEVFSN